MSTHRSVKNSNSSMSTHRSVKNSNSRERQTRAVVNLRELSESPQNLLNDQKNIIPKTIRQQIYNTIQSTEIFFKQKKTNTKQQIHTINRGSIKVSQPRKLRPNTIQNTSLQSNLQIIRLAKHKRQPLTSINFYQDTKKCCSTFDYRTKLNEQMQQFASRIKHEQKLIKSLQIQRAKTSGVKQTSTKASFKTNITKRSHFYQQLKNYLYSSFKVNGKPVQIKKDRYSIESHGLPKKKSIYSFKQNNTFFAFNRTDVLRQKPDQYELDNQQIKQTTFITKSPVTLDQNLEIQFSNRTLHSRPIQKNHKRIFRGKLWLGRPPTSLVLEQNKQADSKL